MGSEIGSLWSRVREVIDDPEKVQELVSKEVESELAAKTINAMNDMLAQTPESITWNPAGATQEIGSFCDATGWEWERQGWFDFTWQCTCTHKVMARVEITNLVGLPTATVKARAGHTTELAGGLITVHVPLDLAGLDVETKVSVWDEKHGCQWFSASYPSIDVRARATIAAEEGTGAYLKGAFSYVIPSAAELSQHLGSLGSAEGVAKVVQMVSLLTTKVCAKVRWIKLGTDKFSPKIRTQFSTGDWNFPLANWLINGVTDLSIQLAEFFRLAIEEIFKTNVLDMYLFNDNVLNTNDNVLEGEQINDLLGTTCPSPPPPTPPSPPLAPPLPRSPSPPASPSQNGAGQAMDDLA